MIWNITAQKHSFPWLESLKMPWKPRNLANNLPCVPLYDLLEVTSSQWSGDEATIRLC